MNLMRFFATIHYLKPTQIFYRLFYIFRKKFFPFQAKKAENPKYNATFYDLKLQKSPLFSESYLGGGSFVFLNLAHDFKDEINWNFADFGKLWTYNLNYFEFLNQKNMNAAEGFALIERFINDCGTVRDGFEPYPVSLRIVNWIKFLTFNRIKNEKISKFLNFQCSHLLKNIEYHLLGNHILENGFALMFGAYFFQDETFYRAAKKLLVSQLEEQILPDGGDFELSPMYHQIILFRLLDTINLIKNNDWKNDGLLDFLCRKAGVMAGWLEQMTFSEGSVPLFNDSAKGIAPDTYELLDYAASLGIEKVVKPLKESGYRKFSGSNYELIFDAGKIGADYIPGHAHADMLSFELYCSGRPLIVDTGVSTYQIGSKRNFERSTAAHNTVVVNGQNQSDVWAAFRVGKRAKITIEKENHNMISASHDGFKPIVHSRCLTAGADEILISDTLNPGEIGQSRLHFHPSVDFTINNTTIEGNNFTVFIENADKIETENFEYSSGFNSVLLGKCVVVTFTNQTKMLFKL